MTNISAEDFLKEFNTSGLPAEALEEFKQIEELYTKKLWHQLTESLVRFVKYDCFKQGTMLLDIYKHFISDFESKINPLALMEMLCPFVIRQFSDSAEALAFLEKIKEKSKANLEAKLLCLTAIGNIHLLGNNFEATKKVMEECEAILGDLTGISSVHGRYYELCSNYHQILSHHNEYYKDALRYLGCTDLDTISVPEQQERAFNLGLAGILGDKVFNFGELLQHPVLDSLKDTPRQWLIDLLLTFNSGDIEQLNQLRPYWSAQPDLIANELKLKQKIMLLCLMEMTFARPSNNRHLKFTEIATNTGIPVEEVEILAMKAMSLGLVQGTIDQVEEEIHMQWVQPRVLDKQQVGKMKGKLSTWCNDVLSMESLVSSNAQEILT
uniref:26S proteasome non-ATPase regulatory subunit 13-like n=1 Tax=Ciona intestinalis TaxID=7719 RepID=UPI00005220B2|nr:26S proteasome non-ATPase regulatory subunit 13-like [Ciona intestinalis]|eukprot:XP_002131243.1 26S proteasome non-ATPase regulatory subunit 13-like [Ciona intestinalis]